jgi:transposase-like protein
MREHGLALAHTTILRWVQHYTPEFEKRWQRYARPVGGSWRMDETYVKVGGEWMYLYGAVDQVGQTVEFHLSRRRDRNAAKTFLRKAMRNQGVPTKITLDASAASHRAVADLKESGEWPRHVQVRTSKYLNNRIEQDHRRIKQRLHPMLGWKSFRTAAVVIRGIELAEKIKRHNSPSASRADKQHPCWISGGALWPCEDEHFFPGESLMTVPVTTSHENERAWA